MEEKENKKLTNVRNRFIVVPVIMLLAAVGILHEIYDIQFNQGIQPFTPSSVRVQQPRRGDILDRNGRVLACSVPEYNVYFDARIAHFKKNPELIKNNIDSIADGLARVFADDGRDRQYYYNLILDAEKEQKIVKLHKKTIDYNKLQKIKKIPLLRDGAYKGGLNIVVENNRVYPYGGMATRTIGFMRKGELAGKTGLEMAYNTELSGVVNPDAVALGIENGEGNVDGYDLVTTLDADIQIITHEELTKTLKAYDAEWGCAVVMDVKTGDVLSISNLSRNDSPTDSNFYENWNYAVSNVCDPGSTIKLPSLMVAFEDKYVNLEDTVDTGDGVISYANGQLTVTDWNHKTKGGFHKLSVRDVFANSSNIGVSKIIDKYYVRDKKEWDYIERIKAMNLHYPSGIDLVGEPSPKIKDPSMKEGADKWSGTTLLQMSYGYEIELTPLQILTFYNAVANNGKMMRPHLMKEIRSDSKTIRKFKPQSVKGSICKKETLEKAHRILEAVIEDGTAKKFQSKYYKIAGKTGTAQTFEHGHYNKGKWRGSFCGYFPADNPKYSCIVVIQAKDAGEYNAVGVFKRISDRIYFMDYDLRNQMSSDTASVLKMPPMTNGFATDLNSLYKNLELPVDRKMTTPWIRTNIIENRVKETELSFTKGEVPIFERMGMRDVLFLADSLKIKVKCVGTGRVSRQSVRAGERYNQGDVVVLNFE
ncbi:MAG: transpeptidase family protein [Bacteroidales bacterium]|nr:transpeptidase family protein [Bacteroidales bacterium]